LSWLTHLFRRARPHAALTTRHSFRLDLTTAKQVAQSIELNNPELVVAGLRPAVGAAGGWIIDVVNRHTGQITSLSEHDNWARRLQEILPCRSVEDARLVQRPAARS
jgi:hypothetical protein